MTTDYEKTRERLATTALVTDRHILEGKLGVKPRSEKNVSDETLARLRDFVKKRATEPAETSEDATTKTTGAYDVKAKDQIVPADEITYTYYEYHEGNINREEGMTETAEVDIRLDGHNVLGMFITSDGILYEGSDTHDADDGLVNGILDLIEAKEAAGEITARPPAE